MSASLDTSHLSKQANRLIDIIQDNELNKTSQFKMQDLVDNIASYESSLPDKHISSSVKTAGLVEQALVTSSLADINISHNDGDYGDKKPHNAAHEKAMSLEAQSILRAAYNDPTINPSKPVYGDGYFDIAAARTDLANGKDVSTMVMPKGMEADKKQVLLEAVNNLPDSLQQLAIQGLRNAADDAKRSPHIGGMKTSSMLYSQDAVRDTLDAYQAFRLESGSEVFGRTLSERFDVELYAARGRQNHEIVKNNPNAESNKPAHQITHDLGSSLANTVAQGLNTDIKELHELSGKPHTIASDWRIKDIATAISDNSSRLALDLNRKFDDATEKDPVSVDMAKGYTEVSELLQSARKMIEEMPDRDRLLERKIDRAGDNFSNTIESHKIIMAERLHQATAAAEMPKIDEPQQNRGPSGP